MKNIIILLLLTLVFFAASAQQTTTVKVPPNKDTTVVKFTTTTTTTANTTTTYTTTSVPADTVGTPTPPPTGGTLLYSNNFDPGTSVSKSQCLRCGISTSIFKDGGGSFMAWYQAGDASISGGYRSELQLSGNESPSNVDLIYELDVYYEVLPSGVQGLSTQWHGTQQGTSGNGSMWIGGKEFVFQTQPSGVSGSANVYSPSLGSIQTGRWYKMRYEIKWSSTNGYVRIFIDGKQVYNLTGKICDGRGQYMKLGINLFNNQNTVKMYVDNVRVWKK